MTAGMDVNGLVKRIREAQVKAAEEEVMKHLEETELGKYLTTTELDKKDKAVDKEDKEADDKILSKFKLPVRFENGYIFDDNDQMMMEVRAWGFLSSFSDGEELQNKLGEMFAEAFNLVFDGRRNG
jgi:hypothetical protein